MKFAWLSTMIALILLVVDVSLSHGDEAPASDASSIVIEEKLLGPDFYLDDEAVTRTDLKEILAGEEACEPHVKKSETYEAAGLGGAILSGTVLLYGLGLSLDEQRIQAVPVSAGLTALALNFLCFNYLDNKHLRLAVDIFNRKRRNASLQEETAYRLTMTTPF